LNAAIDREHGGTGAALGTHGSLPNRQRLDDGSEVLIRPLTPGDAALESEFLQHLSPQSRAFRFLGEVRISDRMIKALTAVDQSRDAALIAVAADSDGASRLIGVARFGAEGAGQRGECAVVVRDDWQCKGVGTLLMKQLVDIARERGLQQLYSIDVADNEGMKALARRLGFERARFPEYPGEVIHTLKL
jgi:acetyltransferase